MEHKLATAEKKVLVELVKLVQKRGLQGEKGGWKEFLAVHDKKFGANLSDPAKRSNDVLAAFLKTFTKEDDMKAFARVLQCNSNWDLIEKFKQESPDKECPEQRLVRLTVEHPEYPLDYSFPSYSEDWFVTKMAKKSTLMKSNAMIAVDCEMVLCEDGTEAVVRVGVVDRTLKVKLDAFVNPNKPIADYRTDITGVSPEDIEKSTRSVADIQRFMRRLLSHGTILVGHSLNNDLQVLKIDHGRVIDTSLIFKYAGARKVKRPSLNNLCKSVLGYEVRKTGEPHDCVQDATAAMKLVLAVLEQGADTTVSMSKDEIEAEKTKLFLHRIPHNASKEELHRILSGEFTLEIKPSKKQGGSYCAVMVFKSAEEANQTFENVEGNLEKDSNGLPQKLVRFKLESGSDATLFVRKMLPDNSSDQISGKKRTCSDDEAGNSKKQKTDDKIASEKPKASERSSGEEGKRMAAEGKHNEDLLKEIESLKQELKNKDFQIAMQDKIIADLRKRLEGKKKGRTT